MAIGVVQLDVKGLQAPQHGKPNPAGRDGADIHRLQIVGPLDAVRDVPTAFYDPVVGRDVVTHQSQNHHHHVLGNTDAVAVRHFGDRNATFHRRLEINV